MADRPTILVVDDTPQNIGVLHELLKDSYRVKVATSGAKALSIAFGEESPDLILLDIMMPEMSGYEVCERLKADESTRKIPVIFLTALSSTEDEEKGLDIGAVDYVTKPISPPILLARVRTHLRLKEANDFLRDENEILEGRVVERTRQIGTLQDVTLVAMGSLAETRDNETGNHIRRTQRYVRELATAVRNHPRFEADLTPEYIELLYKSAPLHDIGKVGVPDHILLKPGPLTEAEFEEMKRHTTYGRDAILMAEASLGSAVSYLHVARQIAYSHQEKWDGSGYPEGLAGESIPVSARLMAVADVYDALISPRVYKPAFSHQQASEIIVEGRARHFDPDLVDAFEGIAERFAAIAREFGN